MDACRAWPFGAQEDSKLIADLIKRALYASGALGLLHRIRNRDALTVAMYHRVIAPSDPRWETCDPDYTMSDELFAKTLRFFKRHYRIVSLEDVAAARRGERALPPCALLVTFDDGWSDNADYALPVLEREGVPAVIFTVADAIGRDAAFWQEQLIAAWRAQRLGEADVATIAADAGADVPDLAGIARLRRVIAALEGLATAERERILSPHRERLAEGRRLMVTPADLARLRAGGVAIGLHGKTHTPMTRADDVDAELDAARRIVAGHLGVPPSELDTLSFPHGRWTPEIVSRARALGYALMFTSVPSLNRAQSGCADLLARVGVETELAQDARGRFRPDRLALRLFRRPAVRLG